MDDQAVSREEAFRRLPAILSGSLAEMLRERIRRADRKVIVLDDDPTGTQTVHDIPVITKWSVEHLVDELRDPGPVSYVLTNSRSLPECEAILLNRAVAENLRRARQRTERDFTLVSRSDSTLRGHFPAELDALATGLQETFDAWIICPFFEEGGRFTIADVHYVAEGDRLIPAAQTPFAADPAFGYRSSNLRHWVVEKTAGRIPLQRVASLSLEILRSANRQPLRDTLRQLTGGSACVVNAAAGSDLESAVDALLEAEGEGKRFLYRTAASFVATRAGVQPRPLLNWDEMRTPGGSGVLVVVGSYVPKTTAQLDHLLTHRDVVPLELDVRRVLDPGTRGLAVSEIARRAADSMRQDATVVIYTSRELVAASGDESLLVGQAISQALVDIVRSIDIRPQLLVAKGGITSSDIATRACQVERATVLGQALPGVPVWRCGPESRQPGLSLVVFPGNVGGVDALSAVVRSRHAGQPRDECC